MAGLGNLFRDRDVSPRFASPNPADEDIADIKTSPELTVVFGRDQDFSYIVFRQFSITIGDTTRMSTFDDGIMDIFHLSAYEQMRGIDTMPDIAFVKDRQGARNRTTYQGPSNAVRTPAALVPRRPFANSELAVPFAESACRPHPTWAELRAMRGHRSALVDLAPEPCDCFFIHGNYPSVGHVPGGGDRAGASTVAFRGGE